MALKRKYHYPASYMGVALRLKDGTLSKSKAAKSARAEYRKRYTKSGKLRKSMKAGCRTTKVKANSKRVANKRCKTAGFRRAGGRRNGAKKYCCTNRKRRASK